jgi:PTH1 family peptidyl-tRNA hydrolase
MNKLLIVGLGNPGDKYVNTRHNIGFMVIDSCVSSFKGSYKEGFKGVYFSENIENKKVFFLKPLTYMNASGESVREISEYYDIEPENVLVVHDDLDMEFGKIKFRKNGSSGGHNGIKSIMGHLATDEFKRLKMGIGPKLGNSSNFVLNPFNSEEKKYLDEFINLACKAVKTYLKDGLKIAMNQFNNLNIIQEDSQCHSN